MLLIIMKYYNHNIHLNYFITYYRQILPSIRTDRWSGLSKVYHKFMLGACVPIWIGINVCSHLNWNLSDNCIMCKTYLLKKKKSARLKSKLILHF